MKLVEQHVIKASDSRFAKIDEVSWNSKNLYNSVNYRLRQGFFKGEDYVHWMKMYHEVKEVEEYRALPAKVSKQVLRQLHGEWQGFFAARESWEKSPEKFNGKPKLPKYKDKEKGRNLLIYTNQAISKVTLREGIIKPSKLDIEIKTLQDASSIKQVRIVPRESHYVVEVIYEKEAEKVTKGLNKDLVLGIDLGINNLATIVSNKKGFVPIIMNGLPTKAVNQYYNKEKGRLQSELGEERKHSKQLGRLNQKRNWKIKHFMHQASQYLIEKAKTERIGTIVIGKNKDWKKGINIGKKNNQKFVSIPHQRLIDMLSYKAELSGIKVITTEESYTSKCSFLDLEPVEKQEAYKGKRVTRGLYRASDGKHINADVNGAYNIIRKVFPDAFSEGIEGVAVHPLRVTLV